MFNFKQSLHTMNFNYKIDLKISIAILSNIKTADP